MYGLFIKSPRFLIFLDIPFILCLQVVLEASTEERERVNMRRAEYPYSGKRYLLNINTGEIHDLDFEVSQCHIHDIRLEKIYMSDTYEEAQLHAIMVDQRNPNGCYYCYPFKDNG